MRQIRPRTSHPILLPNPVPSALTVDLRDRAQSSPTPTVDEQAVRRQLAEARRSIAAAMEQVSILVSERETLKALLGALAESQPLAVIDDADDHSIVPWGFCEDDDL